MDFGSFRTLPGGDSAEYGTLLVFLHPLRSGGALPTSSRAGLCLVSDISLRGFANKTRVAGGRKGDSQGVSGVSLSGPGGTTWGTFKIVGLRRAETRHWGGGSVQRHDYRSVAAKENAAAGAYRRPRKKVGKAGLQFSARC